MTNETNAALRQAKDSQQDTSRTDVVTRVHSGNKLTARERVDLLLDPDSAVEYGSIDAKSLDGWCMA